MGIDPGWQSAHTKFKLDARFANVRLKALSNHYLGKTEVGDTLDLVDVEVFFQLESNRLPLFVGSQFGLHPRLDNIKLVDGHLVAVLCKSMLSGYISGLQIGRYHAISQSFENVVFYSSKDEKAF